MRPTSPDTAAAAADAPSKPVTRSKDKSAPTKTTAFEEHHSSRKREREGSLEPSSTQQTPTKVSDPVPAKKNRLQEDALAEEGEAQDSAPVGVETEKVGLIRKKVDAMSTGEKTAAPKTTDNGVTEPSKAETQEAEPATTEPPANKVAKVDAAASSPPSLPATTSPAATAKPETSTSSPPPLPARTQPTFSSFSSKASPFSAVPTSSGSGSSSKNSFAAFSAKTNSASPTPASRGFGGIQPSDLGSSIGGKHESTAVPTPAKSVLKGPSLGFGAFAGASPLSKAKSPTPSSTPAETKTTDAATDKETQDDAPAKSTGDEPAETFEQKLLREQDSAPAKDDAAASTKTLLPDTPEVDAKTGEEDEETIHSIRAKLYTMAADQSWKERGTGTLRVNIPKRGTGGAKRSARIVMRADGILRVILNVLLFKGMKCELAEKFIRIVAFEDSKPVHYAIKVSNPNNAAALMDVLDEFIVPDGDNNA